MVELTRGPDWIWYIVIYGTSAGIRPVDDVIKRLVENGLNPDRLSKPGGGKAVRRSVTHVVRTSDESKTARTLRNGKPAEVISRIFLEDEGVPPTTVVYHGDTDIFYDAKTGSLTATGPDADKVKALFKQYSRGVTGDDLRQMARRIVKEAYGISQRGGEYVHDAGGVYLVPGAKMDKIESLRRVLEELEIGYVKAFCVADGPSERGYAFEAAISYSDSQIESLMKRAEKVKSRISSLERYKEELMETEAIMKRYASLARRGKDRRVSEFNSRVRACGIEIDKKIKRLMKKKGK